MSCFILGVKDNKVLAYLEFSDRIANESVNILYSINIYHTMLEIQRKNSRGPVRVAIVRSNRERISTVSSHLNRDLGKRAQVA